MEILNLLIYPIVYIIFMPIICFIHELGHAMPALIFTKGEVTIYIGNSNLGKRIKLGKLVIYINGYKSIADLTYGYINWNTINSKLKSIIMIAGGPIASLATIGVVMFILSQFELHSFIRSILSFISLITLSQFLSTAIPMEYSDNGPYKGFTSDGYKIREWLKVKN